MRRFRFSLLTFLIACVMASGALWLNVMPWGRKIYHGVHPFQFLLRWTRGFPIAFDRWTDHHLSVSSIEYPIVALDSALCVAFIVAICFGLERLAASQRMKRLVPVAAAVLLGLTGIACARVPRLAYPSELPQKWDSKNDAALNAMQIRRLGEPFTDYDSVVPGMTLPADAKQMHRSGEPRLHSFLGVPFVQPAVQFGCGVISTPIESSLKKSLNSPDPDLRLLAVAILNRVNSPSSIAEQWNAIQELRKLERGALWRDVLADFARCFEPEQFLDQIAVTPPKDRYAGEHGLTCAIRMAGATQYKPALPRLIELSRCDNLDASLAAGKSLEDFEGAKGDVALVQCILGWQYDAYIRACRALVKRNKPLLAQTLRDGPVPEKCEYEAGDFLAECDDLAAVPVICRSVHRVAIIDRKLFAHIERLATKEHLRMVLDLPTHVRPEQQEMALKTIEGVLYKLGLETESVNVRMTFPHVAETVIEERD